MAGECQGVVGIECARLPKALVQAGVEVGVQVVGVFRAIVGGQVVQGFTQRDLGTVGAVRDGPDGRPITGGIVEIAVYGAESEDNVRDGSRGIGNTDGQDGRSEIHDRYGGFLHS